MARILESSAIAVMERKGCPHLEMMKRDCFRASNTVESEALVHFGASKTLIGSEALGARKTF